MLQIGDYVMNIIWQQEGCIYQIWDSFTEVEKDSEQFITMSGKSWLEQQTVPFTAEQIEKERWFSVHTTNGGSILSCESRLEFISRVNINELLK
jgi:hypothetical protein